MAADNSAEIARLKAGLAEMLKKVPPSVCAAGMKTTKAYKAAVDEAKKVMASPRATLAKVQQSYTAMSVYWQKEPT